MNRVTRPFYSWRVENSQISGQKFRVSRRRAFVSGVRVRPAGPKEPGDALRACSKMRGGRFFRVGASRLTHTSASVVAPVGANRAKLSRVLTTFCKGGDVPASHENALPRRKVDSGVDDHVEDIGKQVADKLERGRQREKRKEHGVVPAYESVPSQASHPGDVEHSLHYD